MEQKKLLWIVAAVSVFVLVIFGFALVVFSPPKTAETERQTASALVPGRFAEAARRNVASDGGAASVDPDTWVRWPEAVPGLDTEIVPAPEAESITSLNAAYIAPESEAREGESAGTETISVRELASRFPQEERAPNAQALSHEAANEDATARRAEEAAPATAATAPARNARPAQAAPAPRVEPARASRQPASSEPARQTVVEYWIQTGSFSSKLNAESARKMLTERYLNAEIFTKEINGTQTYRVRVGPYSDKAEADYWLGTIAETPEFSGSYVSRVTAQR